MEAIVDNFFNGDVARRSQHLMWLGTIKLLRLVAVSFVVALVLGAVLAAMRTSRFRRVRLAQDWFVDIVRALPPLVSLVIVFYLVPPIGGYSLGNFETAVLTFGVIQGAYMSEIYRGGLLAVPRGQHDAAKALGMTPLLGALLVIAPQVVRVIIPPLTSQATQLVRDSSLSFFIGYEEVITRAKQAVAANSNSTPYMLAVAIYGVLLVSMQLLSTYLERRRFRARD